MNGLYIVCIYVQDSNYSESPIMSDLIAREVSYFTSSMVEMKGYKYPTGS